MGKYAKGLGSYKVIVRGVNLKIDPTMDESLSLAEMMTAGGLEKKKRVRNFVNWVLPILQRCDPQPTEEESKEQEEFVKKNVIQIMMSVLKEMGLLGEEEVKEVEDDIKNSNEGSL